MATLWLFLTYTRSSLASLAFEVCIEMDGAFLSLSLSSPCSTPSPFSFPLSSLQPLQLLDKNQTGYITASDVRFLLRELVSGAFLTGPDRRTPPEPPLVMYLQPQTGTPTPATHAATGPSTHAPHAGAHAGTGPRTRALSEAVLHTPAHATLRGRGLSEADSLDLALSSSSPATGGGAALLATPGNRGPSALLPPLTGHPTPPGSGAAGTAGSVVVGATTGFINCPQNHHHSSPLLPGHSPSKMVPGILLVRDRRQQSIFGDTPAPAKRTKSLDASPDSVTASTSVTASVTTTATATATERDHTATKASPHASPHTSPLSSYSPQSPYSPPDLSTRKRAFSGSASSPPSFYAPATMKPHAGVSGGLAGGASFHGASFHGTPHAGSAGADGTTAYLGGAADETDTLLPGALAYTAPRMSMVDMDPLEVDVSLSGVSLVHDAPADGCPTDGRAFTVKPRDTRSGNPRESVALETTSLLTQNDVVGVYEHSVSLDDFRTVSSTAGVPMSGSIGGTDEVTEVDCVATFTDVSDLSNPKNVSKQRSPVYRQEGDGAGLNLVPKYVPSDPHGDPTWKDPLFSRRAKEREEREGKDAHEFESKAAEESSVPNLSSLAATSALTEPRFRHIFTPTLDTPTTTTTTTAAAAAANAHHHHPSHPTQHDAPDLLDLSPRPLPPSHPVSPKPSHPVHTVHTVHPVHTVHTPLAGNIPMSTPLSPLATVVHSTPNHTPTYQARHQHHPSAQFPLPSSATSTPSASTSLSPAPSPGTGNTHNQTLHASAHTATGMGAAMGTSGDLYNLSTNTGLPAQHSPASRAYATGDSISKTYVDSARGLDIDILDAELLEITTSAAFLLNRTHDSARSINTQPGGGSRIDEPGGTGGTPQRSAILPGTRRSSITGGTGGGGSNAGSLVGTQYLISEDQFLAFALRHPAVLAPVVQLQDRMRRRICGETFWQAITRRRTGVEELTQLKQLIRQGQAQDVNNVVNILSKGPIPEDQLDHAAAASAKKSYAEVVGSSLVKTGKVIKKGAKFVILSRVQKYSTNRRRPRKVVA